MAFIPSSPNVLYIIGQLRRGGAEQQLFYLLKTWPHSATIIVLEKNPKDNYWVKPIQTLGYQVIELKRYGNFDLNRLRNVLYHVRRIQPDIIHLFTDTRASFYGRIAGFITQHPCVIANERRNPSNDPNWYLALKRWLLNRHLAAVVANAQSSLDFIITHAGVPSDKTHYIPNGICLEHFSPRESGFNVRSQLPDEWRNKIIIGSVGSLLPKKAPEVWVRVAKLVVDLRPEARFLHVGKGPLFQSAEALRDDLGLADHILFLGERTDVPQRLQAMDIFTMTSRNEGMPNAVMEAMAMRLPCVVTDAGDSRELVRDNETGFVVPIGDEIALADRIVRLIDDSELRQSMGQRGYELIQDFSVQKMAQRYRELYLELLSP